jgi:hypothetical protein
MKNINEAKALPKRFTPKAAKLYGEITNKEEGARKAAQAAYDQMITDGMLWTDFISPKSKGSTATPELYEELKTIRRKGFGAWAQKLYETPSKALNKESQAKKDKLRTQLSRKMAQDSKALRLRQDPEYKASQSKTKAPQQPIHVVKTDDPVINESNKVNAKICKKIRDLQTYIEGNAPVKSANDTRELLRKALELFSQQH